MRKYKIAAIIGSITIISAIALGFGYFMSNNSPGTYSGVTSVSEPEVKTVDFIGTWKAENFTATITTDSIQVMMGDENTSGLYWKGTFYVRTSIAANDHIVVTSRADVGALSLSLMGSQDETKVFTYSNKMLSFKMTIMGTSKVVYLSK